MSQVSLSRFTTPLKLPFTLYYTSRTRKTKLTILASHKMLLIESLTECKGAGDISNSFPSSRFSAHRFTLKF